MATYDSQPNLQAGFSITANGSHVQSASTSFQGSAAAQGFFPGSSFGKLVGWWAADSLLNSTLSGSSLEQWEDQSFRGNPFLSESGHEPSLERDSAHALDFFDFESGLLVTQDPYELSNVLPVSLAFLARFPNTGSVETFWSFIENVQAGVQKDGISVDIAVVSGSRVQVHFGNQDENTFFGSDFQPDEWVAIVITMTYLRWNDEINRNGSAGVAFKPVYEGTTQNVFGSIGLLSSGSPSFNADLAEVMLFEGAVGFYEAGLLQDYFLNKVYPSASLSVEANVAATCVSVQQGKASLGATASLDLKALHNPGDLPELLHWYTATSPSDQPGFSFGSDLYQWEDRSNNGSSNPLLSMLPQNDNPIWKENDIQDGNSVAFTNHDQNDDPFMVSQEVFPAQKDLTFMLLSLPDCTSGSRRLVTIGKGSFDQPPYSLRIWLAPNCDDQSKDDLIVEVNGSYSRSDLYVDCRQRSISPDPYNALYRKAVYEKVRDRNRDPILVTLFLEEQNIDLYFHDGSGSTFYSSPDEMEGSYGSWRPEVEGRIWIGSGNGNQTNDSKYGELVFWEGILTALERTTMWDWMSGRYGSL